jgi:hypothetical protein
VTSIDVRWWRKPADEAHQICDVVSRMLSRQDGFSALRQVNASLYGGVEQGSSFTAAEVQGSVNDRLSINIIRSIVDTVVSRVASKSQPKCTVLSEGKWDLRRKAKKLDKAIYGAMKNGGAYRLGPLVMRDACVFGQGAIKVFEHDGDVAYERVMPGDLFVDSRESRYGDPRSIYQVRRVDKAVLADMFPSHATEINEASSSLSVSELSDDVVGMESFEDHVQVVEAWHLPSSKAAKDGVHAIAINGLTLLHEAWDRPRFPFAVLRWDMPLEGWHGTGLVQELCGIQLEINDLLSRVKEAHALIVGKWFVERSSQVNKMHLNDDPAAIVDYSGTPPAYVTPPTIAPEVYGHLERLIGKAYEVSGISQLAATQQKPAGLNSGTALRAYHEQQSERFLHKFAMFEDFFLDVAKLSLDAMRDIAKDGNYKVKVSSKNYLETIDFKANALEESSFELRIEPSSQLPQTLGGKLEFIEEMAKTGVMQPDELLDMLDSPDTELLVKRKNTTRDAVEADIEHMAETMEQRAPEPEYVMPVAARVALELYAQMRIAGAPDELLIMVRDYMDAIRAAMAPPPPPQALAPPTAPATQPGLGSPMEMPLAA